MRQLLKIPDLIEVVGPFIGTQLTPDDIYRLIESGNIEPLGIVDNMPVFKYSQICDIVTTIQAAKGFESIRPNPIFLNQ
jgi:hypothetical protein